MVRSVLLVLLGVSVAASLPAQGSRGRTPPPPAAPTKAPAAAPAPSDTGAHALVTGFVLDSMTNLPLAGATVVVSGTPAISTTDEGGRFRLTLDNVKAGTYVLGFFHPLLDSLGITPPPRRIEVRPGESQFVELAVPSMRTIAHAVCPDTALTDGRGLVMGVVRDAQTDQPLDSVRVVLMWTGLNVGANNVIKVPKAVAAVTGGDGLYRACGVPSDARVTAQARSRSHQSGWIEVGVPAGGIALRDFLLGTRPPERVAAAAPRPDSAAQGGQAAPPAPLGSAVLVGTVSAEGGKPLEGAQVLLLGTRLAARADDKGNFRLGGLPAGTQSIEVRQIGYAPRRYAVDLSPNRESRVAATLEEHATVLKGVEVTARKSNRDLTGFETRKRRGFGTFLSRDDIERRGAISTTDLFRALPGVQVMWDGTGYVVQMARGATMGSCPVQYYIDGAPFLSQGSDLDQLVNPNDIEGIEIYKSGAETPAQFQGTGGGPCGTVVIWTRRGGR